MMKLDEVYRLARFEDDLARTCYTSGRFDAHNQCCTRRDVLIDHIYHHPDNIHSRRAISSRVIAGLSGHEDELKYENRVECRPPLTRQQVINEIEPVESEMVSSAAGRYREAYDALRDRLDEFIQRLRTA